MTTDAEKHVLNLLADAWNAYLALPVQHPTEQTEFMYGVHRCQDIVAVRVARRADPETWPSKA
jgi:hypothetical protein